MTLIEKRQKLGELAQKLKDTNKETFTPEEERIWNELKTQYDTLKTEIEKEEKTQQRTSFLSSEGEYLTQRAGQSAAKPDPDKLYAEARRVGGLRVFRNFAEQLRAIKLFANSGTLDERLNQLANEERAALGMNVALDSDGGFAVQTDFGGAMMESAATAGQILSRVDRYPISSNADGVKWVDIDETDISTTVFGGVQVYWASEAASVTASNPKLVERKLELLKLMGVAYATYELEQDTSFVSDLYTRAFTLAIQMELEACIVAGTGVGKPLGITKGGDKVTVSKETGQAADTILWHNLSKMYNRALGEKSKFIWLAHPDTHEQFDFMQFPVGTGGVPVYLQAALAGSVDTLKGKPVIDSDHCSALGDLGDIIFTDLNQYLMIYKGGIDAASSIHVQFLTAQNCFRFIFRANGMPKRSSVLTIKNSANARASNVILEAR